MGVEQKLVQYAWTYPPSKLLDFAKQVQQIGTVLEPQLLRRLSMTVIASTHSETDYYITVN
jgi:hypothetical protein